MVKKFTEFAKRFEEIRKKQIDHTEIRRGGCVCCGYRARQVSWVAAKRPAVVGDFLETQFGKMIDNSRGPDFPEYEKGGLELKTHRLGGSSKVTLFCQKQDEGMSDEEALSFFGKDRERKGETIKSFHVDVRFQSPNNIGLFLDMKGDNIVVRNKDVVVHSWDIIKLTDRLEGKMPNLAYITYDLEEPNIILRDLFIYSGFDRGVLIDLIKKKSLEISYRMRTGKNRGTAFRLTSAENYSRFFKKVELIC